MIDFTPSELAIFTAFVAFLGTSIGAYAAIKVAEVQAKSRERTETRKQIIDMALANWKIGVDRGWETEPVENFLVHMSKVFDLFLDRKIDAKSLEKSLKELKAITLMMADNGRDMQKEGPTSRQSQRPQSGASAEDKK